MYSISNELFDGPPTNEPEVLKCASVIFLPKEIANDTVCNEAH